MIDELMTDDERVPGTRLRAASFYAGRILAL